MNRRARRRQSRQSAASAGRRRTNNPVASHADVLARAARHMKEGRPQRADQLLSKLLAGDGAEDPSVLHFAGVARYRCSRFDEAAALLRQATEAAPTYAEAHNSLGILLLETGQTDRGPRRAGARRRAPPRLCQRPYQSRQCAQRGGHGRRGGSGLPQGHRPRPLRPAGAPPAGTDPSRPRRGGSCTGRLRHRARNRPLLPERAGDPRARRADRGRWRRRQRAL